MRLMPLVPVFGATRGPEIDLQLVPTLQPMPSLRRAERGCAGAQGTPNAVFKEFLTSGLSVSAANVCTNPIGASLRQAIPPASEALRRVPHTARPGHFRCSERSICSKLCFRCM